MVYPAGISSSWNAGEYGPGYAIENEIDESAFIEAILLDLETMFEIETHRIYAVGFSMGGSLVYRLACDMSDTFAAVGSVSGPMMYSSCDPIQTVSVIHVHGLADQIVPFTGGGMFDLPSVENGIDTWVGVNQCTESITEEDEGSKVLHTTYSECQDETSDELITIPGMDHSWPSTSSNTIWLFFRAHTSP